MKNNKKRNLAYLVPLLAIPMITSIGHLTQTKSSGRYSYPTATTRTESEQRDLRRDGLENTIDNFGLSYKSFIELAGFERTLPQEYDNWKVSIDVNDNFINRGRQTAVDLSEDGLGKMVQVDLSEYDAHRIIERYRK